jgi:dephospho-CoA kinase
MAWRIGLTGGIGSGKSTVLEMLREMGAAAIDADAISRAVTAPGGAAIPAIAAHFGPGFIDATGALDRARMRELAYAQPASRKELEAIIHPLVGAEVQRQEAAAEAAGRPCIVYDIPLLVESGRWRAKLQRVLVIDCEPETQVARVVARSALAPDAVRVIIAAQAPRALRLAAADRVICNEALTLEALRSEVAQVARTFGL